MESVGPRLEAKDIVTQLDGDVPISNSYCSARTTAWKEWGSETRRVYASTVRTANDKSIFSIYFIISCYVS